MPEVSGEVLAEPEPAVRAGRTLEVCRGEAVVAGAVVPFAVMQATLTARYDRPGIRH